MAVWFAGAVAIAVLAVDLGLATYLRRDADARLTREVRSAAAEFLAAVRREAAEPGATRAEAVHEAFAEWPLGPPAFAVFAPDGTLLQRGGPADLASRVRLPSAAEPGTVWHDPLDADADLRLTLVRDTALAVGIVAGRSTRDLRRYDALLTRWLLVSVPAVALFSLLGGYWLSGQALRPINALMEAIARLAPDDLRHRLPVRTPSDEIDRLAERFNDLLTRLADARDRNRSFLARAAHQIKTPLTVVRGESALALERSRDNETYRTALERVRRAADQMSSRVEDLVLLAHAEAGEQPPLRDTVELDGLALECADLMRGRAQQARRSLELDRVDAGVAHGNERLLREALLELIENAVKHGTAAQPIRVSGYCEGNAAHLRVASAGPPIPGNGAGPVVGNGSSGARGLGLSIVSWIARVHGGTLGYQAADAVNTFDVTWPVHEPAEEPSTAG
jgi:signal transduction histidine kinase